MNSVFYDLAKEIVDKKDGNQVDKDEQYEEIVKYLEESTAQLVKEGMDKKKAAQKVMENLRDANEMSGPIQRVMFPFEKGLLLVLAAISAIYSLVISITWLYQNNDAHLVWFLISTTSSSFVYIFAVKPIQSINRRMLLNFILIIHMFTSLYGAFLIWGLEGPIVIMLSLLSLLMITLSIVLISLTRVGNKQLKKHKLSKQIRVLHSLNITAGIIVAGATFLFLWFLLSFSGELTLERLVIFLPFIIWLISYMLQIKLITQEKKQVAYALAIIPVLLLIVILTFLIMLIFA